MKSEIRIEVCWSYPTSPNAVKFGMSKTGCWTVSRINRKKDGTPSTPQAIKGFNTQAEAIAYSYVYAREICCVMGLCMTTEQRAS
jgi:hypothetical protein